MSKEQITFDQFLEIEKKLEIKMGHVIGAERVAKSKKLIKLIVDFASDEKDRKTVVTNLGDKFESEAFYLKMIPFITNLAPTSMMGIESQAMIVVAEGTDGLIYFDNYPIGSKLL